MHDFSFDCGVYLIKFMQMYNNIQEGMTIDISNSNSNFVRQWMLLDIIFHENNDLREEVKLLAR